MAKERPEWMKYSTVHLDDITPGAPEPLAMEENLSASKPSASGKDVNITTDVVIVENEL